MMSIRTSVVVIALLMLTAGCGGVRDNDLVGRWESTSSNAWIEIHEDLSFEAHDYPSGLLPGGDCNDRKDIERKDWAGTVDSSTLDSGFLYVNGVQWWIDRTITGSTRLRVDICVESLREEYQQVA